MENDLAARQVTTQPSCGRLRQAHGAATREKQKPGGQAHLGETFKPCNGGVRYVGGNAVDSGGAWRTMTRDCGQR